MLEGRLELRTGDERILGTPGTIAYVPGAVPHAFANPHDEPARVLTVITPAGFERYFEAVAQAAQESPDGLPSHERAAVLMAEHGVEMA